jgi:hypothetical protein
MKGIIIMPRSAKERTHERKRKRKAVSATKTNKSRIRRLANKAKRDEIHAIDPDIKVKVIDQVTYDDLGTEIMVENGKIKTVEPEIVVAVDESEVNVIEEIKMKNRSAIQRLTDKLRSK